MKALSRRNVLAGTVVSLVVGWGVSGCSGEETTGTGTGGGAVVGTWNATSFNALGQDLVALGMTLSFTFDDQGSYSFSITNDQVGLCDTGTSCSDGGTYTASDTQIRLDPGTTDEAVINYSINGSAMSISAVIDGVPISGTLARQ